VHDIDTLTPSETVFQEGLHRWQLLGKRAPNLLVLWDRAETPMPLFTDDDGNVASPGTATRAHLLETEYKAFLKRVRRFEDEYYFRQGLPR